MDNIVWFKGKHTVRSGFDLRRLQNVFDNGGFSRGMVVSGDIGEFTSDSETCVKCRHAAFTSPSFDYAIKQPSPYDTTFHSYVVGAYLQDTWRVKQHLTVNLGVRYEYFSPPSETNHQLWNYDPVANGLVRQDTTQVVDSFGNVCVPGPVSNGLIYPNRARAPLPWNCNPNGNGSFVVANTTNFEPRVGVAWSTPSGNTVIRAGFGIFYDEIPASLMAQLAFNRPTPQSLTNPQTIYGQNYESSICGVWAVRIGQLQPGQWRFSAGFQAASAPFALSAIDPSHFIYTMGCGLGGHAALRMSRLPSCSNVPSPASPPVLRIGVFAKLPRIAAFPNPPCIGYFSGVCATTAREVVASNSRPTHSSSRKPETS